MSAGNGSFVWFELMTTDVDAARAFYTEVFGWTITSMPEMDYEMWTVGDRQIGGLMKLTDEARSQKVPPNWLGFVQVERVDGKLEQAKRLGARVVVPGTDIPDIGRFAVLTDPQGAALALYQSSSTEEMPSPASKIGHFGWAELNTTDWQAASRFYGELFGWKNTSTMDMGPEHGSYYMFGTTKDEPMGGMSNAATHWKAPPHWLHYVQVASADETARRIVEKGGKVVNGPMDIPGGGRLAQAFDPQGAAFAVFSNE